MESTIIDDYSVSILLRYLKGTTSLLTGSARVSRDRDLEFLHFYWAISQSVKDLAIYLLENRHETQTLLTFSTRIDDAVARGRIDARTTVIHRLRSGLPTSIVSAEPVRSFLNGPNHVLAWTIQKATQIIFQFLSTRLLGVDYQNNAEAVLQLLDQVRRFEFFRSLVGESTIANRPSPSAQLASQRSRKKLYRLAYFAYRLFIDIEEFNQVAISQMLRGTLLAPLENWRRFELAIALAVGEALSEGINLPLELLILGLDARRPILRCGSYAIYWQTLSEFYKPPPLEPSEVRVLHIASAYGLTESSDRPDLIITNQVTGKVLGIVEVKFHSGENPLSRFREAIHQLVRYSRGYDSDLTGIIERSFVAMNTEVPRLEKGAVGAPAAFSFDDILNKHLSVWIKAKWLP